MEFLAIVMSGFIVGFLVGMTGMGGAALMTPLLILGFGIKPVIAIGTDISYAAITKTVGGWRHLKLKNVKVGLALWLALGSVPGAIGGVWLIQLLKATYGMGVDKIAMAMISGALLIVGCGLLIRAMFKGDSTKGEQEKLNLTRRRKFLAVILGAFTGFVVGITSAGSGTLIAVLLIGIYKLAPRKVVGTDVFHAAILLWAAGLAHFGVGNVDISLLLSILAGSIPGVWIGSHLTVKVPVGMLRLAISVLMVSSGLALLQKAGINVPLVALIATPAALMTVAATVQRLRSRKRKAREAPVVVEEPRTAHVTTTGSVRSPKPASLTE